jgi:NhaA family Na+:H+ antiporter
MIRQQSEKAIQMLRDFLQLESAAGLLLAGTTVLALLAANLPVLSWLYEGFKNVHLSITLGGMGVDKPLLLWINDALMVFFFMLVGLELKREVVEGQLSQPDQLMLPVLAALGGLALPALIYVYVNQDAGPFLSGWAIPTATDIAFALAVLGLMGSRVPVSLKIFLTTIAIVDDLAAIIIIAVFYTIDLSALALALAALGIVVLAILNRMKVMSLVPYLLTGLFIWFCVLKSGVHATLAGVVVAAFIPLRGDDDHSPARRLEHALHPWVAFAVLPVFAFANAGVAFLGLKPQDFTGTIPVGIIAGLFIGKQLGVMAMIGLARLTGLAQLPPGATWGQVYGVAVLCGVGFTMSLFIGSLAFEHGNLDLLSGVKVGVLVASALSAAWGLLVLHLTLPRSGAES